MTEKDKIAVLSQESVEAFLENLSKKGRSRGTLEKYRHDLRCFYDFLPENKEITALAFTNWRDAMKEEGYALRTLNSRISAVNSFLEYIGRRDLQILTLEKPENVQLELTRQEYLRLLSTAKALGKERVYLLVKLFGTVELAVQQLSEVTVSAVQSGSVEAVRIPKGLRQELLNYANRNGLTYGPLFVTKLGRPIGRTNMTDSIRALATDAQVAPEKANPRCLQKLCRETRERMHWEIARLVEQSYEHLLETEQLTIGWDETAGGL